MLKLEPRGKKGTWQIVGTLDGKPYRKSTGTVSREHAEVLRLKVEQEHQDRKYLGPKITSTFGDAVILYVQSGGEQKYLTPLVEHFGDWKLKDIDQQAVLAYIDKRYPAGASTETKNRHIYTPIIATIRAAAFAGLCDPPALKRPKKTHVEKKKKAEETLFASDAWMQLFLAEAQRNVQLYAIVLFMTTTAARVENSCELRWKDVDIRESTATLRITKNGDTRTVPLAPTVLQAMLNCPRTVDGKVFGYASRFSVNQAIERVCKRIGIEYLSSHVVGRHTFAARLLNQGYTLKEVAELGGWKSIQLLHRIYGHLEKRRLDHIAIKVAETIPTPIRLLEQAA